MRKVFQALLAATAFTAIAASAQAADIVPEEAFDWSGFYIGGNIGYGFGGNDEVGVEPFFGEVGDLKVSGVFGGGQVGVNWQRNRWVFGVEADIQASDIKDSDSGSVDLGEDAAFDFESEDKIDWFSTIRGRAGFAVNRLLFYGTGGLAIGGIDYKVQATDTDGEDKGEKAHWDDKYTELGWTAGAGMEWAWSEHLSSKIEYLYVNFGKKTIDDDIDGETHTHATPDFHSVRFGLNWRF